MQHQNFKIEVQNFKVEIFHSKVEVEAEVKVEVRNCNLAVLKSRWKYATATEPPRRTCIRAALLQTHTQTHTQTNKQTEVEPERPGRRFSSKEL